MEIINNLSLDETALFWGSLFVVGCKTAYYAGKSWDDAMKKISLDD